MKQILLFLLFVLSSFLNGQELKYEGVVKVDSLTTKDELYSRARSWIVNKFKDDGNILSIEDKIAGEISGDGVIRYNTSKVYFAVMCTIGYVNFKINIYLKDNRYKYVFHSFIHHGTECRRNGSVNYGLLTNDDQAPKPENEYPRKAAWKDIKEKTENEVNFLINDLKKHMSKQHESSSNF